MRIGAHRCSYVVELDSSLYRLTRIDREIYKVWLWELIIGFDLRLWKRALICAFESDLWLGWLLSAIDKRVWLGWLLSAFDLHLWFVRLRDARGLGTISPLNPTIDPTMGSPCLPYDLPLYIVQTVALYALWYDVWFEIEFRLIVPWKFARLTIGWIAFYTLFKGVLSIGDLNRIDFGTV